MPGDLTPAQARARSYHHDIVRTENRPPVCVPLYRTENVYTRDGLRDLFQRDYSDHVVTMQDVHNYVSTLPVHDHVPFPDTPDIPSEDRENHAIRSALINKHEERREATRRSRQIFDVNDRPVFIPNGMLPSIGDDDPTYYRKAERIVNLRTDDL